MASETAFDYEAIVERIRAAVGGGSDQVIAERLGYASRQTILDMKKGKGLSLLTLAKIATEYNKPLIELLFGYDRATVIGRAVQANDTEIIEKFNPDELSSIGELSQESGFPPDVVIHTLVVEALQARGRVRQPPDLEVFSLASYQNEEDLARVIIKGEIVDDSTLRLYSNVRTLQIPKFLKPGDTRDKDDWVHPDAYHAYQVSTNELKNVGFLEGDLIVCVAAFFFSNLSDGQPVLIPLQEDKISILRFYRDVFSPSRFLFRPLSEQLPIRRFPGLRFADLLAIRGIVRP